jgi:hypothetical protein
LGHALQGPLDALQAALAADEPQGHVDGGRHRAAGDGETQGLSQLAELETGPFGKLDDALVDGLVGPALQRGRADRRRGRQE